MAIISLQIVVVYWPEAQDLFNTTSLSVIDWLIAISVASSIVIFDEIKKLIRHPS